MADRLTVGGLFSGIGGWELGLERAGMEIAWHCEADPFCRRVLDKHWPGVPCYEDVQTLSAGLVEGVDVLCGGFPCQDISLAGKGAGIDGARSGLWAEYARLIGELRPQYVCVENVSALLGRGLDRVLGDLSALGFDAEWDCIPASAVGANHRRDRVWLIAYPVCNVLRDEPRRRCGSSGSGARVIADDGAQGLVADANCSGLQRRSLSSSERATIAGVRNGGPLAYPDEQQQGLGRRQQQSGQAEEGRDLHQWSTEPDVGRVANGVPARVDRLRSLGNALVPQIAEWIGRRIVAYEDSLDGMGVERH